MPPPRPEPEQAAHGALPEETQRLLRARMQALRLGATCCAALGGVACYALLVNLGLPGLVAGVAGLVFAVLGRMALVSLAAEWLVAAARRSAAGGDIPNRRNPTPGGRTKRTNKA
jgi:hypothetical protein